jgi:hypothetical protein
MPKELCESREERVSRRVGVQRGRRGGGEDGEEVQVCARERGEIVGAGIWRLVIREREERGVGGGMGVEEEKAGETEGQNVRRERGLEGFGEGFAVLFCYFSPFFAISCGADKGGLRRDAFPCFSYVLDAWPREIDVHHFVVLLTPFSYQLFHGTPCLYSYFPNLIAPLVPTCRRTERKSNILIPYLEVAPTIVPKTLPADFAAVFAQQDVQYEVI